MKKNLFIILVSFFLTLGLTGCYTRLMVHDENYSSDCPDNTVVIIYPVPAPPPAPVCPRPIHPLPGYPPPIHPQPVSPVNNPGNQGDKQRSGSKIRNDNGGRGSVPRNTPAAPTRTRDNSNSSSNISGNSGGNRVESSNSGGNSPSRSGNTNNNPVRNSNGGRNTGGGR